MIDWFTSLFVASAFIVIMTFSFCFCFKRDRATYSVTSSKNNFNPLATVNLAPLPLSTDLPPISIESDYEKIVGSSGDGEFIRDYRDSTGSMEYGGYTKLTPIRSARQSSNNDDDNDDDETQLYATVDKTRTGTSQAIAAAIRQGSSPASTTASSPQAIFSSSSHLTGHTISSPIPPDHPPPPPPPPPLPPLPPQVYTSLNPDETLSTTDSMRRPHYDEVITRESLQYREQRLQLEEQQTRENYYSSVHSERGTTNGSELYAEIANGSASGTVHPTHYYSRPLTINPLGDDLSERYATVVETTDSNSVRSNNRIYQEVDVMKL